MSLQNPLLEAEICGLLVVAGIIISVVAVGTLPLHQFVPVFQSVLVVPVQVTVAQDGLIFTVPEFEATNLLSS